MNLKTKILDTLSIYEYIGKFIKLKKSGSNYFGLCPFHNEKTSSFSVVPDKGFYHCFGCGKSGNIISFAIDYHGIDFKSALELLAVDAGLNPEDFQFKKRSPESLDRKKLEQKALATANQFFQQKLYEKTPGANFARQYLLGRGLDEKSVMEFALGYAPADARPLETFLLKQNLNLAPASLEKLSLVGFNQTDSGGASSYAYFRNRIIFPIHNHLGEVAGFGGRALGDEKAKYLNSKASEHFDKSALLYNLHRARPSIREEKFTIIVEGYLDVIGLALKGVRNVVAPLGTALTPQHVKILARQCNEIYIMPDGDEPGRKSALKSVRLANSANLECKVVLIPAKLDPFDLALQESEEGLLSMIDLAMSGSDYRLKATILSALDGDNLLRMENFSSILENEINSETAIEKKSRVINAVFADLTTLERQSEMELFIKKVSGYLNISFGNLWADFNRYSSYGKNKNKKQQGYSKPVSSYSNFTNVKKSSTAEIKVEEALIALLIKNPELKKYLLEFKSLEWLDLENRRFAYFLLDKIEREEDVSIKMLLSSPLAELAGRFSSLLLETAEDDGTFEELFARKKLWEIKRQIANLLKQIAQNSVNIADKQKLNNLRAELIVINKDKLKYEEYLKTGKSI